MNEENQFKVGDIVVTKPGFTNKHHDSNLPYGGAGYKENFKFEIGDTSSSKIAWPNDNSGLGIYFKALELYTPEPSYEIY